MMASELLLCRQLGFSVYQGGVQNFESQLNVVKHVVRWLSATFLPIEAAQSLNVAALLDRSKLWFACM